MEHYYILRNNQESGPFTLKELKATGLFATDLVWQDGESTCWKYPEEFEELRSFVKAPAPTPHSPQKSPVIAPPDDFVQQQSSLPASSPSVFTASADEEWRWQQEDILAVPSFEALKQKHAVKPSSRKVWKQPVNVAANLFGLMILMIGVAMAAVMVKKAVDSIDFEPAAETADAQAIETENLHRGNGAHTALAAAMRLTAPDTTRVASMEKVVVENPVPEAAKQTAALLPGQPVQLKTTAGQTSADSSLANNSASEKEDQKAAAPQPLSENEKPADEEATKNAVAALQVSANEYSVGLFGGVSNLELTISNPSSKAIDRALIEVDYLKPNGKVVQTQTVEVSAIGAGGSKKVAMPNSSRGVSVRYRVVNP